MDQRLQELKQWLAEVLGHSSFQLHSVMGDASLRRYFRVIHNQSVQVVADIPPSYESCVPFVKVAHAFLSHQIHVPRIYEVNEVAGFVLMEDLGDKRYQDVLNEHTVENLYAQACDILYKIHSIKDIPHYKLFDFNSEMMHQQLQNFNSWFLERLLQYPVAGALDATFNVLISEIVQQPQVLIHGDYHARNLMQCDNSDVGVLDFQDAAIGPITYDLVSLLRDCYIDWSNVDVERWALNFYQGLIERDMIVDTTPQQFLRYFDWMGIQRHLKAIFIFARKYLAEQDDHYLTYIPRAMIYVQQASKKYPELQAVSHLFEQKIIEKFHDRWAR